LARAAVGRCRISAATPASGRRRRLLTAPSSLSAAAALLGYQDELISPRHLLSVCLIFFGGFLPAAEGNLGMLFTRPFWRKRAVAYCVAGELMVCIYNLCMHQGTYDKANAADADAVLHFFLFSRLANALMCAALAALSPSFRRQLCNLAQVPLRYLCISLCGELLSIAGVCLSSFSYAMFYEPSVVNAAEGGMQQLLNLGFAYGARAWCGFGREVEQVPTKLESFGLVFAGLVLSAW
jgi:hypothetical protein